MNNKFSFCCVFLFCIVNLFSQNISNEDYKIYSNFLENIKEKQKEQNITNQIIIQKKSYSDNIDLEYALSFNYELQKLIKNDSTWLNILNQFSLYNSPSHFKNLFSKNLNVKLISAQELNKILATKKKNWNWKRFYKNFPGSNGVIKLSKLYYNKDKSKLAFYYSNNAGSLRGGGYILLMENLENDWKVKLWITIWES